MRIKRVNEFGNIGTAVYYDFRYFIPDLEYVLDPTLLPTKSKSQIESLNNFLTKGRVNGLKSTLRSNISQFSSSKVLIQGSRKRFDGIDFAEYDFNAVLEDQKFNNKDLISYLDKDTISKVGTSLGSLEKINTTLFPTMSDSDAEANDVEYFGTLSLSAITLYLFNLDPGMYKIELYEDTINENNTVYGGFIDSDCLDILGVDHIKPVVTIYLGPTQECKNNPPSIYKSSGSLYNINDPLMNNRSDYYEYSPLEYSKLYDEIFAGKSVWLALSSDKSIKEVNLSYNAWLHSEDANIFKHKFNLRNDDFHDIVKSTYLENDETGFVDKRSGKLLGNKILVPNLSDPSKSTCPILSRKLKALESITYPGESSIDEEGYMHLPTSVVDSDGYISLGISLDGDSYGQFTDGSRLVSTQIYNPEIEYKVGDIVYHQGHTYKALRSGNRGHFPDISSYWVIESKVNDLYTTRVTILSDPQTAGDTNPNKQITIVNPEDTDNIDFSVSANLGYKFNSVQIEHNDDSREDLRLNTDYLLSDIVDGDDYYNIITVLDPGWEKILNDDSKKRVIFHFITTQTGLAMNYTLDNNGTVTTGNIEVRGFSESPYTTSHSTTYKIILSALTKNGTRYTLTDEINEQLSSVVIGDVLEFEFALVDYKHAPGSSKYIKASTVKRADGIITEEVLDLNITTTSWEYWKDHTLDNVPVLYVPITVDYDDLELNITAATKLFYTVSEFNGFEVDTVNSEVNYGGSQTIQFYGTYRDALDYIVVNDHTIPRKTIATIASGGELRYEEYSPYIITLRKSGTMYTLVISNIVGDLDIKIIEK